jgi:predicted phage terminase large subunit-like protein
MQAWDREFPRDGARWIEDAANGPAVIAQLHDVVPRLIAVRAKDSKVARLSAASRDIEAGNVYLPDPEMPGYAWVDDFIDEVCKCQSEKSGLWDRADAMGQAITQMGGTGIRLSEIQQPSESRPITGGIMTEVI